MSAMGELNFFLGLQVLQKKDGIFLSQDKYVGDILKKFGYSDVRSVNTLMDKENPWGKDEPGKDVDLYLYRSMIGSLMYLTASRPDIMFVVCACARHQVTPKECHLHAVKRIFRYLKGTSRIGVFIEYSCSVLDRSHWENIIKTSALPHDSTPRVTSLTADGGSMQQQLQELTDLCTHLQRQQTEMSTKIVAQDLEISSLKAMIKLLEDKDQGTTELSGDEAPIKGRSLETRQEVGVERSTERGTVSVPPVAEVFVSVPTGSGLVPTVNAIFTTASVVTPYSRRKEMEEEIARDAQRMNEQIARDVEIARIHAEEELQMMIDGLDRRNEMIAKHLHEYEQAAAELTIGEKIELINELVKYQDHHAKILKYQAWQSKPLSKKQQREFYTSVLRSHSGWKTKHFRGMTLEEIREKFIPVWKQIKDFVPMASKERKERFKRKGLRLEQGSAEKMKTSEEVSEEELKEMMQLVPVEEVYVEALQVKHPIID
nr:uncharacterized mitochondrial protein AtMg00810-like [Tanacetum cinerariifolium]